MKLSVFRNILTLLSKKPFYWVILALGFSSGIPTLLISSTLSIWLRDAGVSYEVIGYFTWIGLIYGLKWVWAPMLDQWRLPWLSRLGRRRSWLVLSQTAIFLGLLGIAFTNPQKNLSLFILFACSVAFFSATQDIAIDGYRLEIAGQDQQAALAAFYITGFRLALLIAGAGALILATYMGTSFHNYYYLAWRITYCLFAVIMIPVIIISFLITEPNINIQQKAAPVSEFSFLRQLISVFLVLFLVVSAPVMISALLDHAWPRALLYALVVATCLSSWGRSQILPVRILLRKMRHHLKRAAASKEIPHFDFVHQGISIIIMLSILILLYAATKALWYGAWPRCILYLLIFSGCISAPGRYLMAPILTPMVEFVQRYRWRALLIIGIISTFKLSDTMASGMLEIFLLDNGFSTNVVAVMSRGFGILLTIIGAIGSVFFINKFKVLPALFFCASAGAITNLLYLLLLNYQGVPFIGVSVWMQLIHFDGHVWTLMFIIIIDNLVAGASTSALLAYLSGLTNLKFSASQYAILSSFMLLLPKFLAGYSGQIVQYTDYKVFFIICALLGLPCILLTLSAWLKKWY